MNQETTRLPEWKNMFDTFKDAKYGDVLSYSDPNRCLTSGDVRENKSYVFSKFRKEMLVQQNKYLENERDRGYRIVLPNEHVRLTGREVKRAERRARQAVSIILHTNMEKLTAQEQEIARLAAARVQPILATIIGEQKALQVEAKTYRLPSIPRRN